MSDSDYDAEAREMQILLEEHRPLQSVDIQKYEGKSN